MTNEEIIRIAKTAIRKKWDFEQMKYSDDMYGREYKADDVWELVEECERIGTVEFQKKYGSMTV